MKKLLLLLLILLSGCFSSSLKDNNYLNMTYYSVPSGADIYEGNKFFGRTPITVSYPISEQNKRNQSMTLKGTRAIWVSGATTSVSSLIIDWNSTINQYYIFNRPSGVAGMDNDKSYELQIERNKILRDQAAAEKMGNDLLETLIENQERAEKRKKRKSTWEWVDTDQQAVPSYSSPYAPSLLDYTTQPIYIDPISMGFYP